MKTQLKKGFTLIELLVVITIIGILATGATAVYTSQIQKARDTTRINDVKALQSGVEQAYQDLAEYPKLNAFNSTIGKYMAIIPKDAKDGQPSASGSWLGYTYTVSTDDNGILFGVYELSTALENSGNVANKAKDTIDKGSDDARYEIGIPKAGSFSLLTGPNAIGDLTATTAVAATTTDNATPAGGAIHIAGTNTYQFIGTN